MASDKLKNISAFSGMSDDITAAIEKLVHEESYDTGSVIFEEGSLSDKFYIIKSGEVEIKKKTETEGYKMIAVLSVGEFFGEMAVFLGQPRTAEAVARTNVTLLTVSKDDISGLFSRSPEGAFKIMEILTFVLMERLRNTTKELVTVYETGKMIASAHSVRELSENVMTGMLGAIETAEAALFVVWNEFNEEFEIIEQRGFEGAIEVFPFDDDLIRWFSENGESFLSFNLKEDRRLPSAGEALYAGQSLIASPFFTGEKLKGFILVLNRTRPGALTYNHMILLSAVSGYVTVALDNLRFVRNEIDRTRLEQARSSIKF